MLNINTSGTKVEVYNVVNEAMNYSSLIWKDKIKDVIWSAVNAQENERVRIIATVGPNGMTVSVVGI